MLTRLKNNLYQSEKLKLRSGTIHGFSGRGLGSMSLKLGVEGKSNVSRFLEILGLNSRHLVLMEQVHRNKVVCVGEKDKRKIIRGTDGLVTADKEIILGVKMADCLPILFFEPEKKIIGVAHAGWKGILAGVIPAVVKKMKNLGAKPEKIIVGIGPHIGGCCYTVLSDRAKLFQDKFGDLKGMMFKKGGELHLNLAVVALGQLEKAEIKKENIEVTNSCTFHQNEKFFSFRREEKELMLGIISLIN